MVCAIGLSAGARYFISSGRYISINETSVGHGCEITQSGLFALMYSTHDLVVSSEPKLTSNTALMPTDFNHPFSSRSFPLKLTIAAGATMAIIGTPFFMSAKNAAV